MMILSAEAETLLRAMRGSLRGSLEGDEPFCMDPGWTGPVRRETAEELHGAGFIEIDEDAPLQIPYAFRISTAGRAYLASRQQAKTHLPYTHSAMSGPAD